LNNRSAAPACQKPSHKEFAEAVTNIEELDGAKVVSDTPLAWGIPVLDASKKCGAIRHDVTFRRLSRKAGMPHSIR
jgi:hypothetical protein